MRILITAGEPSGDLHASNLIREIKKISPDMEFFGLGGGLMAAAGVRSVRDISKLAIVGLAEVFKNVFAIKDAYNAILREVDLRRPDMAILVDYPGFNLRLAKELKARDIPVVYYISPQLWAWGKNRIEIIKGAVARMLVFFKFEEEFYKRHGVSVEFVGHPLVETARPSLTKEEAVKKYDLDPSKKIIALLPGSRKLEVENLFPIMLKAADLIAKEIHGAQFIVVRFPGVEEGLYKRIIARHNLGVRLASADTYNILSASGFAIAASGTATLETAIIGTPMVIVYKLNLLTYIAFKLVSKIKNIGIVNIIAGSRIAPEFTQFNATPEKISAKVVELMSSPEKIRRMKEAFSLIKNSLGAPGSYERSARAVLG